MLFSRETQGKTHFFSEPRTTVDAQKYCTFSSPAPPSESLNKKLKKVVILQFNYSLEKIGLLSDRVRRFGVILSGGRGVKKYAIFLSTNGSNLILKIRSKYYWYLLL